MNGTAGGLTSLDRVCLILIAVMIYMAIRFLQDVHSDISAIAKGYEVIEQRHDELSRRVELLEVGKK